MTNHKFFMKFVIPMFNAEEVIERCLQSIADQTDESWFIQVYDDLSTDKSVEKVEQFIARFPDKIELIQLGKKLYAGGIRNESVKHVVDSEYVWFIDNDDFLTDNHVLNIVHEKVDATHELMYTIDAVQFKYDKMQHHAPWFRIVKTGHISPTFMEGPMSVWSEDIPQFYYQYESIPDENIIHISYPCINYSGSHNVAIGAEERRAAAFRCIPEKLTKSWLISKREQMRRYLKMHGQNI